MTQESRLVIVIDSKNAERNTRAVADELVNLTNKGVQADTQMTAMSSSIKSLVGYMGGILTINKAIAMADGYTQMAARIRNATESAAEYDLVQDRLLNTANTTYRQLGEAQEVYLSMAGGMKSLGKSTKDTLDLTDSLSFSFTHNATRVDQAQSAMDALSKSMAKGKVDGDAWISIVTGADNVIADMAKTTGKTESEIRKLGAEGKISLEDLIRTLIVTREQNEKLANNMENSLADGFTKLSNEVTVYLGKANEATSATGILAGGLSTLADNLDIAANTGAALGIGYITSALLTKGAAVKANLVLSAQQQIADRAELVSQTQITAAEVRRTASLAQFTTMQLADAKATAVRMTGIQRLAYVQSTVIPLEAKATQATAAHTAATAADTVAQEINNKARSRGAMLLGLVGGPIGAITLGVTALAAGYMYMSSRTAEANAKLEEQGKIAEKTNEELKKLTGNDKKSAIEDLTAAFAAQNIQLGKSKEAVDAVLFAIRAASIENEKARKVTEDARRGVISYDEAIKRLNEMDVPTDLYDMLKKQAKEYDVSAAKANTSKVAFKAFGIEVKLAGNEAQNASSKIAGNTKELNVNETAAQKAAQAQTEYQKSLADRKYYAEYKKILVDTYGFSEEKAEEYAKAREKAGGAGAKVDAETRKNIDLAINAEKHYQSIIDARNKAESNASRAAAKTSKDAESEVKRRAKEAEQLAKEQFDLREQLIYQNADHEKQIELDLANEIAEIRKAKFTDQDTKGLISNAETRAGYEKELYVEQLKYQLNEWQWSEEERLDQSVKINRLLILSTREMTDTNKQYALDSMVDQSNQEQALILLAQETRLFQMREYLMSETAAMQERYRLEREQILLNSKLTEEQKQREIELSKALQQEENRRRLNSAVQQWGGIQAEMNGTGGQYRLEQERFSRYDASQNVFDSQMSNLDQRKQDPAADLNEIALLREQAWFAHHERMKNIESDYQTSSYSLQLGYGQQVTGALSGMFGAMLGESSSAYRDLYTAQQSFALAQAGMNVWKSASDAYANEPGTWYQKAAAAALATIESGTFVTMIQAATPKGFKSGGYTGNYGVNQEAGVVHGQEYVLNAAATKRVGVDTLDAINSGKSLGGATIVQPKVVINNYSSEKVETSTNSDGELMVTIGKMLDQKIDTGVDQGIQRNLRQGYPLANAIKGR